MKSGKITMKRLAVKTSRGIEFIKQKNIVYCSAHGRYSSIFTIDGKKYLISKLISELEDNLNSCKFFRTHRSFIVNLDHMVKYERGGQHLIVLDNGMKVELSRRRRAQFKQCLMERIIVI